MSKKSETKRRYYKKNKEKILKKMRHEYHLNPAKYRKRHMAYYFKKRAELARNPKLKAQLATEKQKILISKYRNKLRQILYRDYNFYR